MFLSLSVKAIPETDSAFVETAIVLHTATGDIFGTLTTPKIFNNIPVALIIAGSGPTDRNGNNPMMKNESLRMLAYKLVDNNIASLRFDKRAIAASQKAAKSEAELRFDDYVNDAKGWIGLLKTDKRFSKVVVIGHSEGSLIGMIASLSLADAYVSIAGAGRSADKVLKEQLAGQEQSIKDISYTILDSLVMGKTVKNIPSSVFAWFRPSIQPYLISWFKYDPQTEIKKLNIPVLILQGTNDIQVTEADAHLLAKANVHAHLVLIKNMNHVFKIIEGDKQANIDAYNNPALPISTELANSIIAFIKK